MHAGLPRARGRARGIVTGIRPEGANGHPSGNVAGPPSCDGDPVDTQAAYKQLRGAAKRTLVKSLF